MRKRCLTFIFYFINLLFNCYCIAQDIHFNLVTPPKNEPWGRVSGMVQDPQGFLWMATNAGGLYRYDGYNYTAYHHDPSNPNSLGNEWIESIYGSSRDNFLLLGTFGFGLDRFDLATGNFTHHRYNPKDTTTLSNDTITSIIKDQKGMFWIGTENGLNQWNPQTGKFVRFKNNPNDSSSLSDNQVRVLYLDREGTVWIGTKSVWPDNGGTRVGGLNRYNPKTGNFKRYMHKPNDPQSLTDNQITALFEDSRGTFWVGTAGDGLHTMDRGKGTFTRHLYDPKHPERLSRPPLNELFKKFSNIVSPYIVFISEDSQGKIWIGTFDNGINVYDPATRNTIYYGGNARDSVKKLTESAFSTAFTTTDGTFWLASWGSFFAPLSNLYKINLNKDALSYTIMGKRVYNFYEDGNGVLWIATAQGLYKKGRDGTMQQFVIDKKASSLNNMMVDIEEDKAHNLWIATLHNGLYRFNPITQTFIGYHHEAGKDETLISDSIYTLALANDNKLWIGTWNGLDELDISSGTFKHYIPDPSFSIREGGAIAEDILISKNTDIWACVGRNVNRLNKKTGHFKKYLLGDFSGANNISEDNNGDLWVGDGDGLYRYNKEADVFTPFYDSTGVINRKTSVFNITEDTKKNLWLKTPKEFIKLNVQKKEASVYETKGHDYDNFFFNSYVTHKGEILSGDTLGYIAFHPDSLLKGTRPPAIAVTGFALSDQPVNFGTSPLLPEPVDQVKELRLKNFQNTFSFSFTSIDFTSNGEDRHIVYLLENYDSKWRKADVEGTAGYYNVPPGKYVFKVKAMNNYGEWAQKEINVVVSPPWWRTWWAYSLYGLLFISGVFMADRIQRRSLIAKERERAREKELAQAREIEKAYNELKRTQTQLIQSEKMASLGELTAGIAHEIQNPLNFVNNFSDVNKELIAEMKEEIDKGNIEEVKIIATDIEENEQKINHHGKRADAIVKGMLQHSRANTGKRELTDINALADEYLRLSYHGLRAKDKDFNADFKTDFDESIDKIEVVPQDIGRVLLNLYNNAFYAVNEKKKQLNGTFEPAVTVTTKRTGSKVEVVVKDNGYGIPQKVIDKIFQPFFTTKPTGQGTGLGLSLSYDIIKAHGGELNVETKEGEGAEFIIQLPSNKM
jgi:signal transduction histidine kinase/ligand-binding sensor domain-containing protein